MGDGKSVGGLWLIKTVCLYQETRFWRHFLIITMHKSGQNVKSSQRKGKETLNVTLFVTSHSCINFVVISQNCK